MQSAAGLKVCCVQGCTSCILSWSWQLGSSKFQEADSTEYGRLQLEGMKYV